MASVATCGTSNNEEYPVERLLQHRDNGSHRQYLVRWAGYDARFDVFVAVVMHFSLCIFLMSDHA